MRVGLLGGTFNPPHIGHLVMAQEALDQLGLDRVLLMPVHTPPHKELAADPGPRVRVELCRLATAGEHGLEVSTVEIDRPGPSYTVDTLRAIHATRAESELTFIVGGDMAVTVPAWREPAEVLSLASLAVGERDGVGREEIAAQLRALDPHGARVRFFEMPRLDVSSSDIRNRVAAGRPIRHLVPEPVAAAIATQGLYAGGSTDDS